MRPCQPQAEVVGPLDLRLTPNMMAGRLAPRLNCGHYVSNTVIMPERRATADGGRHCGGVRVGRLSPRSRREGGSTLCCRDATALQTACGRWVGCSAGLASGQLTATTYTRRCPMYARQHTTSKRVNS
jgi:hypothetical protein